ncbi:MAG: hypothetical protein PUC37_08950 [Spirochaetales bacterium]|nr:hypothetical protein [Spirochaetales bacterium]
MEIQGFNMNALISEYSLLLKNEDKILDTLSQKQMELRNVLQNKDWSSLTTLMADVNRLSDDFQRFDSRRDELQKQMAPADVKSFYDILSHLRSKLLKCKLENQVITNYVTVTKQFISEVVEKALPQTRNKNYTKDGTITQPHAQSVLVDVRG